MSRLALTIFAAALLTPVAAPAFAQDAPAAAVSPKSGSTLRDVAGRRLGTIDSVRTADGYVTVISDMKLLRVPIATLKMGAKGLVTTLKASELR